MPLFSIITPVYNNERYVENAVRSVLRQEFTDYEYIIVDDGSTDNTPWIVDRIADENEKVRVIHQENQWIYASFNNGIREADGKYIYILNSDDLMREGALSKMARVAKEYEPDVIYTQILVHKCDGNQRITSYDYLHLEQSIEKDIFLANAAEVRNFWYKLTIKNLNQNQANLYKRELMIKHPFRNDVYGADTLFNIAIADEINSAFVMKDAVYDFMEYGTQEMNASIGKYYPYLHEMFNDIYLGSRRLYEKWDLYTDETAKYWIKRRMHDLTTELCAMSHPDCHLSTEEKVKNALLIYEDDVIYESAWESGRMEELESRVLSGIRMLLTREVLEESSSYYFIYEMLEALLCYETSVNDYSKIERGVYHPLNKKLLGKSYLMKIRKENCWEE